MSASVTSGAPTSSAVRPRRDATHGVRLGFGRSLGGVGGGANRDPAAAVRPVSVSRFSRLRSARISEAL